MQRRNEWYTRTLGWRLGQVAYILVITGIIIGYALYQFGPHGVVPEEFQAISQ